MSRDRDTYFIDATQAARNDKLIADLRHQMAGIETLLRGGSKLHDTTSLSVNSLGPVRDGALRQEDQS